MHPMLPLIGLSAAEWCPRPHVEVAIALGRPQCGSPAVESPLMSTSSQEESTVDLMVWALACLRINCVMTPHQADSPLAVALMIFQLEEIGNRYCIHLVC